MINTKFAWEAIASCNKGKPFIWRTALFNHPDKNQWNSAQIVITLTKYPEVNKKQEPVPKYTCRVKGTSTQYFCQRKRFESDEAALAFCTDKLTEFVMMFLKSLSWPSLIGYTYIPTGEKHIKSTDANLYVTSDRNEVLRESAINNHKPVKMRMMIIGAEEIGGSDED